MNRYASLLFLAWLVPLPALAITCGVSVGILAFGAYSGIQANSSATMMITCYRTGLFDPLNTTYSASLSAGGSGNYAQRLLTQTPPSADTLNYNLYLTTVPAVLNTSVWGNGTGGTIVASGTINMPIWPLNALRTSTHTVAGAIAAGSMPSAGSYQDSIVVTLTYN